MIPFEVGNQGMGEARGAMRQQNIPKRWNVLLIRRRRIHKKEERSVGEQESSPQTVLPFYAHGSCQKIIL